MPVQELAELSTGRFRAAVPGDLEALLALERAYYAEDRYPFSPALAKRALGALLEDPALGQVWVAEMAGKVVAYVVLALGYSLEYGGRDAFIDELYVDPDHRGRGLGREALAVAETGARALGVRALHLEVERDKAGVRALYRERGFADHDRLLMTKELAPPWHTPVPS
jgi:GNAT superfamily N-acetyltransferase